MPEKILVMDEQGQAGLNLADILADEGFTVLTASGMADGRQLLKAQIPDLIIADVRMPIAELLDELEHIKAAQSEIDLIVLASPDDQAAAMDWLGRGVYDYLPKPLSDRQLLVAAVHRALQKRRLIIQNNRLVDELQQSDIKDPLTGVYNHHYMQKCLLDEIVRSARYNHHFLLILADIDHLETINDIHGRKYGDRVLTRMARLLEDNLRLTDIIFRYDGGKFLMLLPETRKNQAVGIAERILECIRYHDFSWDEVRAQVTVSMGAAEFPSEARNVTSLLGLADFRLSGAKNAGRNCFCFKTYETLPSGR